MKKPAAKSTSNAPRPPWIPDGIKFDKLPRPLQILIEEIISPLYEQQVLNANTPLQKAIGLDYVHLAWLTAIEQFTLAKEMAPTLWREGTGPHQEKLDRHMKLMNHKDRTGRFLLEVEKFNRRFALPELFRDPMGVAGGNGKT
jgi:hypothetical protein